ncbi:hypothetical protein LTR33_013019 [Friedmanniomyces endolithicus]|nr:hypothetical protein LTR33_013019 [Friedmanniomyces endolithicus]
MDLIPNPGALPFTTEDVLADIDLGSPKSKSLCDAVRNGDEAAIQTYKSDGPYGMSTIEPKVVAIQARRPDLLKLLLEKNDRIDESLVVTACGPGVSDYECIRTLLDFGWSVDAPVGLSPSMLSLAIHDPSLTQWLYDQGANVNARSMLNETALSYAIAHGNMEVVRFLLEHGAEIAGANLLHCTVNRGKQAEGAAVVEELVQKGADVDVHRFDNDIAFRWRALRPARAPLHEACELQNVPVVEALLRNGADPHIKRLEKNVLVGKTALEEACNGDNKRLIRILKEAARAKDTMKQGNESVSRL